MSQDQFSCQACHELIWVNTSQRGQLIICPLCQAPFEVPALSATPDAEESVEEVTAKADLPVVDVDAPRQPRQRQRQNRVRSTTRTSAYAILCFVFAVLGITNLPFIGTCLGLGFGVAARFEIAHHEGDVDGSGLNTAGLILVGLQIAIYMLIGLGFTRY